MTNSASDLKNLHLVKRYSDQHGAVVIYFTAATPTKIEGDPHYTSHPWSACQYSQKQLATSLAHATPCQLYLVLCTTAEGSPKLCTSHPLHQTEVLPLGELDFLHLLLFTTDPRVHSRGVYPSIYDNNPLDYGRCRLRDKSGVLGAEKTLVVVTRSAGREKTRRQKKCSACGREQPCLHELSLPPGQNPRSPIVLLLPPVQMIPPLPPSPVPCTLPPIPQHLNLLLPRSLLPLRTRNCYTPGR